jgi:uncharacterized Zn finger protein
MSQSVLKGKEVLGMEEEIKCPECSSSNVEQIVKLPSHAIKTGIEELYQCNECRRVWAMFFDEALTGA